MYQDMLAEWFCVMFQVYKYNESVIQGGAHANLVDLFEEVAANSDNSVTITHRLHILLHIQTIQ